MPLPSPIARWLAARSWRLRAHQQWDRIGTLEYPDAYLRRMIVNEHLSWRRRSDRLIPHAEVELGWRENEGKDLSGAGLFAPPVHVSDDADRHTRLLGLFGRAAGERKDA